MDEEDEIRIINENETLEEIYEFLDDLTCKTGNISDSIMNIYETLHKLEKNINNESTDNDITNIRF